MRFALLSAVVASAASAQSATLVANASPIVWWSQGVSTGTATLPAGPLANGGLSIAPPQGSISMTWSLQGTALHLLAQQTTPTNMISYHSDLDVTMTVSAPPGTFGHIAISYSCHGDFVQADGLVVDIGDDAVIETDSTPMWPDVVREWRFPVTIAGSLPIRITHHEDSGWGFGQAYGATVEFVAWSSAAQDLGTSCAENEAGPMPRLVPVRPYFLAAVPSSGSVCTLVATGLGPFQVFVASLDPTRASPTWSGLGPGCDDVLLDHGIVVPGVGQGPFTWTLDVPYLPGLVTVYVQHLSIGDVTMWGLPPVTTTRVGVTNLVAVQT